MVYLTQTLSEQEANDTSEDEVWYETLYERQYQFQHLNDRKPLSVSTQNSPCPGDHIPFEEQCRG